VYNAWDVPLAEKIQKFRPCQYSIRGPLSRNHAQEATHDTVHFHRSGLLSERGAISEDTLV